MRRGGLVVAMPIQDEASAELTDARKNEPTTIIGGTVPLLIAGSARAGARQLEHLAEQTGAGELIIDAASEFGERRSARDFLADITNSADNR